MTDELITMAVRKILDAQHLIAFTGAGISVESGISPFRGKGGLWTKYDPSLLDIRNFMRQPIESWQLIIQLFYNQFQHAQPNGAHRALAEMESMGSLKAIITQNIDNLHQRAGSVNIIEFHGNSRQLICTGCNTVVPVDPAMFKTLPPVCENCGALLKPDFIFFGEGIPEPAGTLSFSEMETADVVLVIGTSGEIYPASSLPVIAKQSGAYIIEINPESTNYTQSITDCFLQGSAVDIMTRLINEIRLKISALPGIN
ncbi:MAG: NAD-dependent deacylase [Calditrichaceae bacterium]|nr:NAD-dependent deacylase [Calditrichaceae bacterium]